MKGGDLVEGALDCDLHLVANRVAVLPDRFVRSNGDPLELLANRAHFFQTRLQRVHLLAPIHGVRPFGDQPGDELTDGKCAVGHRCRVKLVAEAALDAAAVCWLGFYRRRRAAILKLQYFENHHINDS